MQLISVLRKHLVTGIGQFSFSRLFNGHHQSANLMPLVSYVKTTKSYEVSFVTISWQTWHDSYPSSRVQETYTRFVDWVTICVVHLPKCTEMGRPNYRIEADCTGWPMHSCNIWFAVIMNTHFKQ